MSQNNTNTLAFVPRNMIKTENTVSAVFWNLALDVFPGLFMEQSLIKLSQLVEKYRIDMLNEGFSTPSAAKWDILHALGAEEQQAVFEQSTWYLKLPREIRGAAPARVRRFVRVASDEYQTLAAPAYEWIQQNTNQFDRLLSALRG